jgi:hypothetical protein
MSDRVSEAFDVLMSQMEEPPTWDDVTTPTATSVRPTRWGGPSVALIAAVATVLVVGAAALFYPFGDPIGSGSIPYVRLNWTQEVNMRCSGMETVDNGGFDSAVVEIWGPNDDDLYRIDATAPDGTVERLIVDLSDQPSGIGTWATYGVSTFAENTVFRVTECAIPDIGQHYSFARSPIEGFGVFPIEFVELPGVGDDGNPIDLESAMSANFDRVREDVWNGLPVVVFSRTSSVEDDLGTVVGVQTLWVDLNNRRAERHIIESQSELGGDLNTTIDVVERSNISESTVSFSTDALVQGSEPSSGPLSEDGNGVTTTSIAPTDHPLMKDADEIDAGDVPTQDLLTAIAPREGDRLYWISATENQVIVRLRLGEPAHLYATSCDVLIQVDLPNGWQGTCLERTLAGERQHGVFPYGTTSE